MGITHITNIKAAISDGAFGKMSLNFFTLNLILKEHGTDISTISEKKTPTLFPCKVTLKQLNTFQHQQHKICDEQMFQFMAIQSTEGANL
jgi:hypothetical protein